MYENDGIRVFYTINLHESMIFIIIHLQRMSKLQQFLQSDSYEKFMDILLQLNSDYAESVQQNKEISTSEKKSIIKAIGAQNYKESKNVRRRLRKLKELDGKLDNIGSFVVKEIKSIISNSQIDFQEKKTRIKNIIDQFSDQIDRHYQIVEKRSSSDKEVQIEGRAGVVPYSGIDDVNFINKVHKGRLIRGVFIGLSFEEYQTFLVRDVTPKIIDVDDQSIEDVGIYVPEKVTTKISTRQFETREQKQFSRRDAEMGTVNFSADFSSSWFVSVSVSASAEFSQQKESQNSSSNEKKYYCKQLSHQILKKQVIFDKFNLKLNVHFKNKIKELENTFNTNLSENAKMTLNKRIWKEVFEDYGTHFYTGAYIIGGRYDYLVETNYTNSSEKASVVEEVSRKVKIQASIRARFFEASTSAQAKDKNINVNTSQITTSKYDLKEETLFKGGSGADAKDFISSMEKSESWCVLGETKMEESYIPIWNLVKQNYKSISAAFVAQIEHAYYTLLRSKMEVYLKSLHSKITNYNYGPFTNQRVWVTNGSGFGAIYTQKELFIGNLLNKRAHGIGVRYPYTRNSGQVGIWKNGVLVQGVRIFPNSKYNYSAINQNLFDNLNYAFMINQETWSRIKSNQANLVANNKTNQSWIFSSASRFALVEGQENSTQSIQVFNPNEEDSYDYYHDRLIGIEDKISFSIHLQNVPSEKVAIGVKSASEVNQEKASEKSAFFYHNFNKNVYDGSSAVDTAINAHNGESILFEVNRVENKLTWKKGEQLIAEANLSDYLKDKNLRFFVKLEVPKEAVNLTILQ